MKDSLTSATGEDFYPTVTRIVIYGFAVKAH